MKLLRLTCAGVRGVPDGTYSFTDARTGAPLPVVLVTGGSASGKTSLLETIVGAKEAVGSYGGSLDPMRLRRPGAHGARITATWLLSDAERDHAAIEQPEHTVTWELGTGAPRAQVEPELRRLFSSYSRAPGRGKLEYFPADRRIVAGPRAAFGQPSEDALPRLRATRDPQKYACLIDGLREAALTHAATAAQVLSERGIALRQNVPDALQPYKDAVAAMLPELRLRGFDLADEGGLCFLRRTLDDHAALAELSESERQGVLFALAFRYFGLEESLVLIDEPELHIHAADRVRFLRALVGLGTGNQLIVATGAAELVQAAAPGQVIDLATRGRREITAPVKV